MNFKNSLPAFLYPIYHLCIGIINTDKNKHNYHRAFAIHNVADRAHEFGLKYYLPWLITSCSFVQVVIHLTNYSHL